MQHSAQGFKHVGFADVIGGGQVVVDGTTAYIAHMFSPHQNTIVDVKDPKKPKVIAEVPLGWPKGVHAHKVRAKNGLMVTNLEPVAYQAPAPEGFKGGINIYDVSNPAKPRHLQEMGLRQGRRASLHLRRALRLHLALHRRAITRTS